MPFLNSRGDACHGVGGGYANVNNHRIALGGVMGWWDDDTVAFFNGDDNWIASLCHVPTQTITRLADVAGNHGYCSGQQSAAWWLGSNGIDENGDAVGGVWSTVGVRKPLAGLMGMGPDNAIAYKPDYQSMGPTVYRRPDGSEWVIIPGSTDDPCLLGEDRILWMEGLRPHVLNLPPLTTTPGQQWMGKAAFSAGQWWYGCYDGMRGVILHPFAFTGLGYSVVPTGDAWVTLRALGPDVVRVCWSEHIEEQAGQIHALDYDLATSMGRDPWGANTWAPVAPVDVSRINYVAPPTASASFSLDKTAAYVGEAVTARLTSANLTTWRWTLNGVIHQPVEGQTHGFEILMPGTHTIGLRTMPAVDVPSQTVTVVPAPIVVTPPVTTPEAFWRMQTFDWFDEGEAAELQRRQWKGVRVEGTNYAVVMDQCRRYGFRPIWILNRGEHKTCPGNIDVCVGNENNDGCGDKWPRLTAKDYSDWVLDAWPTLRDKGCIVYAGEANNTSVSGLAWTKDVLSRLPFHPQLRGSIHRYMMHPKDQRPEVPQKGHASIAAEDAAILDCFRGRQFGLTETGIMDVQYRSWSWDKYFGKVRWRLAVDGHLWQAKRFKRLGATMIVVYQIHSGGDDLYGVFVDGQWNAAANLPTLL